MEILIIMLPLVVQFIICLLTEKNGVRMIPMVAMVIVWFISVVFTLLGGNVGTRYFRNTIGVSDQQIIAIYGVLIIPLQIVAWRAGDYVRSQL